MRSIHFLSCVGLLLIGGFLGVTVTSPVVQAAQTSQRLALVASPSATPQLAPAYLFRKLTAADQTVSPADWRGRKIFVNFFASWCVKCRAEHGLITELRRTTTAPVIGISHLDRPDDTQKMLDKIGNPYSDVLEDKSGKGGRAWGLVGVPASFILDAQGQIIWQRHGPIDAAMLKDEILPHLATP